MSRGIFKSIFASTAISEEGLEVEFKTRSNQPGQQHKVQTISIYISAKQGEPVRVESIRYDVIAHDGVRGTHDHWSYHWKAGHDYVVAIHDGRVVDPATGAQTNYASSKHQRPLSQPIDENAIKAAIELSAESAATFIARYLPDEFETRSVHSS